MTPWPAVFQGKLTVLRKYSELYQRAKAFLRRHPAHPVQHSRVQSLLFLAGHLDAWFI
jgi:hypothetical protein